MTLRMKVALIVKCKRRIVAKKDHSLNAAAIIRNRIVVPTNTRMNVAAQDAVAKYSAAAQDVAYVELYKDVALIVIAVVVKVYTKLVIS